MKQFYTFIIAVLGLSAAATNHQVQVGSNFFSPAALYISAGDTVTWTQVSGTHNVNGTLATFPNNPVGFGNGATAGGTWTYSFVFTTLGQYAYQCDPHAAMGMVGTVTVTAPCSELYFSEYLEGSSNNKALEIYNPTNAAINLSTYSVKAYNNGGLTISNSLQLPNKTIAAHDVYVIANSQAVAAILGVSDTTSTVTFFNGDDAVVLFKGTDTLDIIGKVGNDPGTNWTVGSGATSEFTLVRKMPVNKGQRRWTVGATEWNIYPQNTATYLGSHSSNCASGGGGGGGGGTTAGLRPIGTLRGVNANGVADSLGADVAIKGVVTSIDFDGNTGYSFYVQDATGGINVFKSADLTNYTSPLRGDSLYIHGIIDQFNGLTEIVPDSIGVWGTNKPLPNPLVITTMDETNEGELVRMNNMTA
ncbi:MAG: hypothetical protein RL753_801, partial [Bacteroidota bacterium]